MPEKVLADYSCAKALYFVTPYAIFFTIYSKFNVVEASVKASGMTK